MKLLTSAIATIAAVVLGPAAEAYAGYYAFVNYTNCIVRRVYVEGVGYVNATGPFYDSSGVVHSLDVAHLEVSFLVSTHGDLLCDSYTYGIRYAETHRLVPGTYRATYTNPAY
jgi:hypothetical protein